MEATARQARSSLQLLDKSFVPDVAAATRENTFEAATLDLVICEHLYREGHFDLGDMFASEAGIETASQLKQPYVEMHQVLQDMDRGDLRAALSWSERNRGRQVQRLLFFLRFLSVAVPFVLVPLWSTRLGLGAALPVDLVGCNRPSSAPLQAADVSPPGIHAAPAPVPQAVGVRGPHGRSQLRPALPRPLCQYPPGRGPEAHGDPAVCPAAGPLALPGPCGPRPVASRFD